MINPLIGTILPIITVNKDQDPFLVSFEGTAILIAPKIVVTCWHCVQKELPEKHNYAVIKIKDNDYIASDLEDIEQDSRGYDLATARCDLEPDHKITLCKEIDEIGQQVFSFGFPDSRIESREDGWKNFYVTSRFFQSYVMRSFLFSQDGFPKTKSFELAMAAPEGLSGAPIFKFNTKEIMGIIYGNLETSTITQYRSIDPETGDSEPEIQRIVSYGLAHHLDIFRELSGKATNDKPIKEILED